MTKNAYPDYQPQNGDLVRLPNGQEAVLEDINTPGWEERDEYWAEASGNGGMYNITVDTPEGITLVKTAAQLAARKLPTKRELAMGLDFSFGESFRHTGTDDNGKDSAILYGTTDDGLNFSAEIKIIAIEQEDN